jgi:hypothetical protein
MSIGTHQQVVDPEKFNPNFEQVFRKNGHRPGKTKYVLRNGELVVKDDGVFKLVPFPENLATDLDRMRDQVLSLYQDPTVQEDIDQLKRDGLFNPSPELLRTLADQHQ